MKRVFFVNGGLNQLKKRLDYYVRNRWRILRVGRIAQRYEVVVEKTKDVQPAIFVALAIALLLIGGCSSLPAAFFEKDRDFSFYGLYSVNPTTGMTGLGVLGYTSKTTDDVQLKAMAKRIDDLEAIVTFLVRRATEGAPVEAVPKKSTVSPTADTISGDLRDWVTDIHPQPQFQ